MDTAAASVRTWSSVSSSTGFPVVADPRRVPGVARARRHADAAARTSQPQLGFDEWVFGGTAPTVAAAARAVAPGRSALVRLPGLARVPQPLRGDARRSRSCCGSSTYPLFRRFRVLFLTVTFAGFVDLRRCTRRSRRGSPAAAATCRTPCASCGRCGCTSGSPTSPRCSARRASTRSRSARCPSLHAAWPFLLMRVLLADRGPLAGRCSSRTRSRWRSRSCTPPTTSCSTSCSAGPTSIVVVTRSLLLPAIPGSRVRSWRASCAPLRTPHGQASMRRPLRKSS